MSNDFNELELYRAFFEDSHISFWVCDKDLNIIMWNLGAEKIYEYKKEEVLGKYYIDLFIDEPERDDARKDDLATINQGFIQRNRIAYDKTKYGRTIYMLTNCFPIINKETGEVFKAELGVEISDLDLRKNEHVDLRAIGEERIARKIEQKERLTSTVVQDIQRKIDETYSEMSLKKKDQRDWYDNIDLEQKDILKDKYIEEMRDIDEQHMKRIYRLNELRDKAVICNSTSDLDHVKECLIDIIRNEGGI